jgi:hypothetical protein
MRQQLLRGLLCGQVSIRCHDMNVLKNCTAQEFSLVESVPKSRSAECPPAMQDRPREPLAHARLPTMLDLAQVSLRRVYILVVLLTV